MSFNSLKKKEDVVEVFEEIFIKNPRKISIQLFSGKSKLVMDSITEDYYLNKNIKTIITTDLNTFYNLPFINKNEKQANRRIFSSNTNSLKKNKY